MSPKHLFTERLLSFVASAPTAVTPYEEHYDAKSCEKQYWDDDADDDGGITSLSSVQADVAGISSLLRSATDVYRGIVCS
jgi:hypothetical protein